MAGCSPLRESFREMPDVPTGILVRAAASRVLLILTFALGEYGALHALRNQHAGRADEVFVVGALVVSGWYAVLIPMWDAFLTKLGGVPERAQWRWVRWLFAWSLLFTLPGVAMPAYALYRLGIGL